MLDLLKQYSLQDIIIFIVILALAIKGCISFVDWAKQRISKAVVHSQIPRQLKNDIEDHSQQIEDLKENISEIKNLINLLIESDKDAIKAFITRQHHYFVYQKGWVDDYSLNCVEERYNHYKDQGGNSFITTLMTELRNLPKQPDIQSKKEDLMDESKDNQS